MKVGRNEPCPCKSGKKFKKCHGRPKDNSEDSASPEAPVMMPRHKVWRKEYRLRRYMEYLTEDELVQRAKDILSNTTVLTDELKIGLHPIGAEGEYWWRKFTDFLEECVLREYKYPEPLAYKMDDTQIPKYDWPGLENAVEAWGSRGLMPGKFLLKYGKACFLKPLLEQGVMRIAPAAMYDDPSLSPAVRDTELEISIAALPSEVSRRLLRRMSDML